MTSISGEIDARLDQVRRRWRRLEIIKAVSVGVVEALGLLMVFMLVDFLYAFSEGVRLVLLLTWVLAVLAVVGTYVVRPLGRRISDADLALFIEEHNPGLQGALLSATEFGHDHGTPLHNYIIEVLVREASRRIRMVDVRRTLDFSRLRKYAVACLLVIATFVLTGALFPQYFWRHSHRMLVPWAPEPEADETGPWRRGLLDPDNLKAPIRFRITPGEIEVLQGASVQVIAELSRDPLKQDVTLFVKSDRSDWEKLPMTGVERIYTFAAGIEDINTPLEYYVAVADDASKHYRVSVRKRLKVVGLEMTTEYPAYLRRPPVTVQAYSGDVATLKGSKVTLNVKTNQPITEGKLVMGDGSEASLALTDAGGKATLAVEKDDTYRYVVRNAHGEEVGADRLFFIQALPDLPPVAEVLEPNNDLTVHPLSEITCSLRVTEDWALDAVRLQMEVIRQGEDGVPERRPLVKDFLPAAWTASVKEGTAAMTLALDEFGPLLAKGDSIFYHFEVTDRKGQKAVSPLFFVSVSDPEVFIFYGDMTVHGPEARIPISPLFQFIAAAWNLEQQRDQLPADQFLEKSQTIARKMLDPVSGELIDFIRLGVNGDGKGPVLADGDPRKKVAADHTRAGHELLEKGEPGKATFDLKIVWAILKQFLGDKAIMLMANAMNPNAVILEEGQDFAQVIADLSHIETRDLSDLTLELQEGPDRQVNWRRKLGRKEMEKVAEARKDIEKLKREVENLAEDARRQQDQPQEGRPAEPGDRADERTAGTEQQRQDAAAGEETTRQQGDQAQRADSADRPESGVQQPQQPSPQQRPTGRQGLAEQASRSARSAEDLAQELQQAIGDRDDTDVRDGLDNLRGAADELKRAARNFQGDEIDAGAARARTAHRFLDRADKDLANLKFGRLNEMVAQALSHGHRLADRQKRISKGTDDLAAKSDEIKTAEEKGDRRAAAERQALDEKARGLTTAQTALSEQAEVFGNFVERMQQAAEESKEQRVAGLIADGVNTMKRRELPQKMVDAAVEIAQGGFREARKSQDDASKTIETVVDSLYRASDALSGTRQGALERAARRARDIKKKTLALAGTDGKDTAEGKEKPDDRGTAPGDGKDTAEGKEKPDDRGTTPGDGKDTAEGKEKPDDRGTEAQGEDRPGVDPEGKSRGKDVAERDDEGAADEGEPGEGGEAFSRVRRRREASRLWSEVRTLAGDLRAMEYVPRGARERLGAIGEDEFGDLFDHRDERRLMDFISLVGRVSKLLDEKLIEAQTAKKLESGLREECPPGYRRLVGHYYSVLSAGE